MFSQNPRDVGGAPIKRHVDPEHLIIPFILLCLGLLVFVGFSMNRGMQAKMERVRGDETQALLSQLRQALKDYQLTYGELPSNGLAQLESAKSDLESEKRVLDAWKRPVVYRIHREVGMFKGKAANLDRFELYSVGPNGIDESGMGDDVTAGY